MYRIPVPCESNLLLHNCHDCFSHPGTCIKHVDPEYRCISGVKNSWHLIPMLCIWNSSKDNETLSTKYEIIQCGAVIKRPIFS